jgi:hypothetical protein
MQSVASADDDGETCVVCDRPGSAFCSDCRREAAGLDHDEGGEG